MAARRSYVELEQFLDLERHWAEATDQAELCHRICATAALLLDTPTVAIRIAGEGGRTQVTAQEGVWNPRLQAAADTLAERAASSGTAQLKSLGEETVGAFPFRLDGGRRGILVAAVPRPILEGTEVAFLRFLASVAGALIRGEVAERAEPSEQRPPEQESIDAVRRYLAMAVHDLRNPLNVLAGYAGLLAAESLGPLNEDQKRAVAAIDRQVTALAQAIEHLIDVERIARGECRVEPARFEVRTLFDDLAQRCFAHVGERLTWPQQEAAFDFFTDRRRLQAIIQNLVDNALRHSGENPVAVECTRARARLVVRVVDRGPGLDAATRAALAAWGEGRQAAGPGGLGLCIVATNVRLLGGHIEVRDRRGGGTEVEVIIPPWPEHAAQV